MKLTERQWAAMENLLPESRRIGRRGRPAADNRACVEGILWVLRSGARWRDLPPQYPSPVTCWRRLRRWEETFLDATFFPAKKGGSQSVKRSAARARKPWYWPLARVYLWEFASPRPRRTR